MEIKYIIINYSGEAAAAINRCNCFRDGLKKIGIESNTIVLESKLKLKLFILVHYLFSIYKLLIMSRKDEVLIFYGHFPILFLLKYFKKKHTLIIGERNEYPNHIIKNNIKNDSYLNNLDFFDGFITCSDNLKKFYETYTRKKIPFKVIPCIVKTEKFNILKEIKKKNYFTYCGDIGNNKDGVPDLIKAFSFFIKDNKSFKLKIIGDTKDQQAKLSILELIDKLKLKEFVIMQGRVAHEKVPHMLKESKVLVLARPNNKQAEGGFPSKVCEYLATGVPSLITATGELNNYLTHKEHVFFSQPDNPLQFSNTLKEMVLNYEFSLKVAEKGKEINKYFDYINQSNILLEYIKEIMNER